MNDERLVNCKKLGKSLPGLSKPPFPGELGKLIFENISEQAWLEWRDGMQMKVLNEYRLNMSDSNDYQTLMKQMKIFLNLESGDAAEVENSNRGRQP